MFEHGRKYIDCGLGSEGIFNVVEGIEFIECDEKFYSDHRGSLTDFNLELCFEEQFNIE